MAFAETEITLAKDHKRHYDGKLKEHEKTKTVLKKNVEALRKSLEVIIVTCALIKCL